MNGRHFVQQRMEEHLLERVGRYCSSCYREFDPGESAYYDLYEYRYLCRECAEDLARQRKEESTEVLDEMQETSLF